MLGEGSHATVPARPTTVTVITPEGLRCQVPHRPMAEALAYVEACQKLAFDAWAPSKGLLKKHPATKTSFLVSVGADGGIQSVKAGVLSGDKKLDQSALDAIAAVPKFPVPVPSLAFEVERGVVIELSTKAANKRAAAK
jgi:hypothetical protein